MSFWIVLAVLVAIVAGVSLRRASARGGGAGDAEVEYDEAWEEHKSKLMEASLGAEHDMVMHALIPYAVGGGLDLYYYPHGVPGTAIATKEVCPKPGHGSKNKDFDCYELVMFTRHAVNLEIAKDKGTPFGAAHANINGILNLLAPYSAQAKLNANDTCEFPADMEEVGGKCLIFDAYATHSDDVVKKFGLLAAIEIFRSEMEFARANSGAELIERLKNAGVYPYSDLDRDAVA